MRGTVAKRLRKKVYGDNSRRQKKQYYRAKNSGTLKCIGLRGDYLTEKDEYKKEKRQGESN